MSKKSSMEFVWRRLAELWEREKRGTLLTPDESIEFTHCLNANVNHWWKVAYLENLSLMASMTSDVDWQHEICLDLDHRS